jgi:hypothetical protein
MHVDLDEGCVTDAVKAVDLAGLDHENVTGTRFEFLPADGPEASSFSYELDFIVRMAVGSGATPGQCSEEEHRDMHVAVIGPDELMRAALEGQVLLTNAVHPAAAPIEAGYGGFVCRRFHDELRS